MVLSHAERLGRCHQDTREATYLEGHCFGCEGVSADGARWAMLLSGAKGNDDPFAVLEIRVDLRPAA